MEEMGIKESVAVFRTSQSSDLRPKLVRFNRLSAVVELATPDVVLRTSEVIPEFQLLARERVIYSGRAVVRNLLDVGSATLCEVTLAEDAWSDVVLSPTELQNDRLNGQFQEFLVEWQKLYFLDPTYKAVVADMHTFLTDLRLWLEQVQVSVRAATKENQLALENATAMNLAPSVLPCLDVLFERFERVAEQIPPERQPAHRNYMRRQLHGLVMCAPFAHRTFVKPLGFAGDYEMVNMIARNQPEGDSLFAKVVNTWFVHQPPAEAHRNRLTYLQEKLAAATMRAMRSGGTARVLNLACGPAHEVQEFIAKQPIADRAQFTLVDFNEETLNYTQACLDKARLRSGRRTKVVYSKKSVYTLLKESGKRSSSGKLAVNGAAERHDYIYCAGLFDYLSDQVCAQLVSLMYSWVAPGGLLVVTNVEPRNPLRHGMEHLLDWHLIYRDAPQMLKLRPEAAAPEDVQVLTDDTGVNVFLELRKPG